MMKKFVSTTDFSIRASALIGLRITRAWKGYGSTVFLDLGELSCSEAQPKEVFEACIRIDWDWRIEGDFNIICGSSNSGPEISNFLEMLHGKTIKKIVLDEPLRELIISISNGLCLRSMTMLTGSPQWSIKFGDGIWLSCDEEYLIESDGSEAAGLTQEEERLFDHTKLASDRWGTPVLEPNPGCCGSCQFHVRLDGNFYFLDYGVCSNSDSQFDGKVTKAVCTC